MFRWGSLDELEDGYARAGQPMAWKGKPAVLLGRRMHEPGAGHWSEIIIDNVGEHEHEREGVAFELLKVTGLPINPERFEEVKAEVHSPKRTVTYAVCLTEEESGAARLCQWPRKDPVHAEFKWYYVDDLPPDTYRCVQADVLFHDNRIACMAKQM